MRHAPPVMDDPQDIHDMLIERVHHHVLLHLVSPDHLISRNVLAADVRELLDCLESSVQHIGVAFSLPLSPFLQRVVKDMANILRRGRSNDEPTA